MQVRTKRAASATSPMMVSTAAAMRAPLAKRPRKWPSTYEPATKASTNIAT